MYLNFNNFYGNDEWSQLQCYPPTEVLDIRLYLSHFDLLVWFLLFLCCSLPKYTQRDAFEVLEYLAFLITVCEKPRNGRPTDLPWMTLDVVVPLILNKSQSKSHPNSTLSICSGTSECMVFAPSFHSMDGWIAVALSTRSLGLVTATLVDVTAATDYILLPRPVQILIVDFCSYQRFSNNIICVYVGSISGVFRYGLFLRHNEPHSVKTATINVQNCFLFWI